MASTASSNIIHFLDDFLDSNYLSFIFESNLCLIALEGVPLELKREMDLLTEKDKLFEGIKISVEFVPLIFRNEKSTL